MPERSSGDPRLGLWAATPRSPPPPRAPNRADPQTVSTPDLARSRPDSAPVRPTSGQPGRRPRNLSERGRNAAQLGLTPIEIAHRADSARFGAKFLPHLGRTRPTSAYLAQNQQTMGRFRPCGGSCIEPSLARTQNQNTLGPEWSNICPEWTKFGPVPSKIWSGAQVCPEGQIRLNLAQDGPQLTAVTRVDPTPANISPTPAEFDRRRKRSTLARNRPKLVRPKLA